VGQTLLLTKFFLLIFIPRKESNNLALPSLNAFGSLSSNQYIYEIGQQIVNKQAHGDLNEENGDLAGLLSKKFVLEVRKNMIMNLI
jgi:hypothetical protein